jgi:hypothetical protein
MRSRRPPAQQPAGAEWGSSSTTLRRCCQEGAPAATAHLLDCCCLGHRLVERLPGRLLLQVAGPWLQQPHQGAARSCTRHRSLITPLISLTLSPCTRLAPATSPACCARTTRLPMSGTVLTLRGSSLARGRPCQGRHSRPAAAQRGMGWGSSCTPSPASCDPCQPAAPAPGGPRRGPDPLAAGGHEQGGRLAGHRRRAVRAAHGAWALQTRAALVGPHLHDLIRPGIGEALLPQPAVVPPRPPDAVLLERIRRPCC